jgi:hypothetical protein
MLLVNKADLLPLNIRLAPSLCNLILTVCYLYCLRTDIIIRLFNAGRDGLSILRNMIFSMFSGQLKLLLPH